MSDPLVHSPGALYRPRPMLSGHRGITDVDLGIEANALNTMGLTHASTGEKVDPLLGSLKHAWMMNDDGVQTDEVSTKDLFAGNSPTRVTGKIGFAQKYASGLARRHYHHLAPAWGANNWDWAISLWVRTDIAPSSVSWYYFNVENNTGNTLSITHDFGNNRILAILSPDSGSTQYIASALAAPVAGTWYHVMVQYKTDTSLQLWINNVSQQSIAAAGGYANGRVVVGARVWNGTQSGDCSVDAIHFWDNYELTSDDRAYLYNSGAGRELV